jgi:tetratricopeptide (TPR) repeat protein
MKPIVSLVIAAALIGSAAAQTPAVSTPAQQAEQYYRQGQAAEKAGNPEAAKKAYQAALQADPNNANARYSLGQLKLDSGAIAAKGREARFDTVMIPEYRLDGASLQEAIDALRVLIERQNKNLAPNFVIQDPGGQLASARISLTLKNVPAKAALKYVLDQSRAKAKFDEHAVVITPINEK